MVRQILKPSLFSPPGEFSLHQNDGDHEGCQICYGNSQQRTVQAEPGRQKQCQRDQDNTLAHQRDDQRLGGLADALEKGGGGHMDAVHEERHHI